MDKISRQLKKDRLLYRELFMNAAKSFKELMEGYKKNFNTDREWKEFILKKIRTEIEPDINKKVQELLDYRKHFLCKRTGTCCSLACSEFSYEELTQRAKNNDNFASQFTSVFVPYENTEDARKVYPEYVDLVLSTLEEGESANFFYCKHRQGKNICPIYEDRPQICRDFPDNPFAIIPPSCGYHDWKEEIIVAAYTYYAMAQIYGYYYEKISEELGVI